MNIATIEKHVIKTQHIEGVIISESKTMQRNRRSAPAAGRVRYHAHRRLELHPFHCRGAVTGQQGNVHQSNAQRALLGNPLVPPNRYPESWKCSHVAQIMPLTQPEVNAWIQQLMSLTLLLIVPPAWRTARAPVRRPHHGGSIGGNLETTQGGDASSAWRKRRWMVAEYVALKYLSPTLPWKKHLPAVETKQHFAWSRKCTSERSVCALQAHFRGMCRTSTPQIA